MQVKEKLNNLFEELSKHNLKMFEYISVETFQDLYISYHGFKTLTNYGETANVTSIAKTLSEIYKQKWDNVISLSIQDFERIDSEKTEIITETRTGNETNTNAVTTFDSDDFTDNDKNSKETNTGRTYSRVIKGGLQTRFNMLEYLKNDYFFKIIFNDINSILTLSIY